MKKVQAAAQPPGTCPMVQLTRLNSHPLLLNADLIKFVEESPDTVITLVTGEKVVVRESAEQVVEKVVEFRRLLLTNSVLIGYPIPPVIPSEGSKPEPESGDGESHG